MFNSRKRIRQQPGGVLPENVCLNHFVTSVLTYLNIDNYCVSNSVDANYKNSELLAVHCMFRVMPRSRKQKKSNRRKRHSTSAPPCLQSLQKRLKWNNASMVAAMEEVKKGCISVKRVSEQYDVPRTAW